MMAQEYKKEMQDRGEEPYKTDKSEKSESQKNLTNWTKEEWQTSDGSANAKQEDGSMKRYLPKKAWENMTEEEKKETEDRKAEGDKEGKQVCFLYSVFRVLFPNRFYALLLIYIILLVRIQY